MKRRQKTSRECISSGEKITHVSTKLWYVKKPELKVLEIPKRVALRNSTDVRLSYTYSHLESDTLRSKMTYTRKSIVKMMMPLVHRSLTTVVNSFLHLHQGCDTNFFLKSPLTNKNTTWERKNELRNWASCKKRRGEKNLGLRQIDR